MQELSKDQLKMAVMGQFMFATSDNDRAQSTGIRRYNHF